MIKIVEKDSCCGCEACVQACPKHCIAFDVDSEGFRYPKVNTDLCVECGLCERVCPTINPYDSREPLQVYAAKNPCMEERLKSSSGGIFVMLSKNVLRQGGVVFGARFDDRWKVFHSYTEVMDGITPFMGSKYVQSRIGDAYIKVRDFLRNGRKVLFSGTPCQITGLRHFLQKEYENLITVDIICHGVPSPTVWNRYLEEIKNGKCQGEGIGNITSIQFRDKRLGWNDFSFTLSFSNPHVKGKSDNEVLLTRRHDKDPFFLGFNDYNLYLRPSCMSCPARDLRSGSDITLADFWGIETLLPEMDDDKGISVVMANTAKGLHVVQSIDAELHAVKYSDVVCRNQSVTANSVPSTPTISDVLKYRVLLKTKRDYFFHDNKHSVTERVRILGKPSILQQIKRILRGAYRILAKRYDS